MALPDFTMRQLLEAGVHFGHQAHRWNPKMASYIFGTRNNIHIIDLAQSVPMLHRALQAVSDTAAKGGRILFVGTKRQAQDAICRRRQAVGAVLRQFALARRHADQLENDFGLDLAPAQARRDAQFRRCRRLHQERAPHHAARARQARPLARRHQGHGRRARPVVRDRHQQGRHRHQGSAPAQYSGRGHRRHQFRSGRHHLCHSGQRRRQPRRHALLRPGGEGRDRRHFARAGRGGHRCRRGGKADRGAGADAAGARPISASSSCPGRAASPTISRSCPAFRRRSKSSSTISASSTSRRSPSFRPRPRTMSAKKWDCPAASTAGSRRPRN